MSKNTFLFAIFKYLNELFNPDIGRYMLNLQVRLTGIKYNLSIQHGVYKKFILKNERKVFDLFRFGFNQTKLIAEEFNPVNLVGQFYSSSIFLVPKKIIFKTEVAALF